MYSQTQWDLLNLTQNSFSIKRLVLKIADYAAGSGEPAPLEDLSPIRGALPLVAAGLAPADALETTTMAGRNNRLCKV
jgi:hypothetical protein